VHIGLRAVEDERKRAARLQHREDAHQPLLNPVTLGDLSRRILLAEARGKVLKRPIGLLGHSHRVRLHPCGILEQERLEAAAMHFATFQELRHRPAGHDGQVAAKQHAVEAGQHTVNAVLVLVDERLHASLRATRSRRCSSMPASAHQRFGCGRRPR
jgi:hypothetical protein